MRKALKHVFPEARITGCYFHFVKASLFMGFWCMKSIK